MLSKIVKLFDDDDYKFLSELKDKDSSEKLLNRLGSQRVNFSLICAMFVVIELFRLSLDARDYHPAYNTVMMLITLILAVSTDHKIKMIMLYQSKP